jgi:Ankyrin repeats (3 copies)
VWQEGYNPPGGWWHLRPEMRKSLMVLLFGVGLLITTWSYAACLKSPDAQAKGLRSYEALVQRQEAKNDPDHAAQIEKAVIEMGQGNAHAVQNDIKAGLSPNATVKTSFYLGFGPHITGSISLLTAAVAMCQEQIAEDLVESGASPNGGGNDDRGSPLNDAAAFGMARLADFLIKHGADVNQSDVMGNTPLENAVIQHQAAVVSVLLKDGANPQLPPRAGSLHDLKTSKNAADRAIAKELSRYGANSSHK